MAWTVTREHTVLGNKRVVLMKLSADAATQTVESGIGVIDNFSIGVNSMTTVAGFKIAINSNASGVASNGVLGLSGFTNGDVIYVTVYGR